MTLKEIADRDSAKMAKIIPALLEARRKWWIKLLKNKTPFKLDPEKRKVKS